MAQQEDVYEKFDRLLILCDEIVEDIKARIAVNPNLVEMQENNWLYSIMSVSYTHLTLPTKRIV